MQSRDHSSQANISARPGQDGVKGGLGPGLAAYFVGVQPQRRPILSLRFSGVLGELREGVERD